MKLETDPWKHILLEDFLSESDFTNLRDIAKNINHPDRKTRLVKIYDNNGYELRPSDVNDPDDPLDYDGLFTSYYDISKSVLAFLDPSKVLDIKTINFEIQSVIPNYTHDIHHDKLDKLLSIVVYLDPDKNYGTFVHKSQNSEGSEIPWVLNSGIAFSASKNYTWHSFKADNKRRSTFNINLYNNRILR